MSLHAEFRGPKQEGKSVRVYLTIYNCENKAIFTACAEVEDDAANVKGNKLNLMKKQCQEYIIKMINEVISEAISSTPVG